MATVNGLQFACGGGDGRSKLEGLRDDTTWYLIHAYEAIVREAPRIVFGQSDMFHTVGFIFLCILYL